MAALRRIDSHCHIIPPFYAEAVTAAGAIPARGGFPPWSVERALEMMDTNDIEVAITSVVPGVHFMPTKEARDLARRCNDYSAELCARWPKRFGAFALLPMHEPEHAIDEIGYALDVLKLDGVCVFSSYGDHYLGDPVFDPVLDALNQRGAVVFVHPYAPGKHLPGSTAKTSLPYPAFILEYPFDTTRMAAHLAFTGRLARYSNVKIILPHAGGALPYLAWRLFVAQMVSEHVPEWTYDRLRAELSRFWFDTALSAGPEMLACLQSIVGPDHIVFGSDWPMANDQAAALCIQNLSADNFGSIGQRSAFARGNAIELFPRLVAANA